MGLRAATLNSSNTDEWADVRAAIDADEIDVLLVSPERFANAGFRAEVLPVVSPRSGLLVVDEAHCISDWGHDFRPDYRRIVRILELLPARRAGAVLHGHRQRPGGRRHRAPARRRPGRAPRSAGPRRPVAARARPAGPGPAPGLAGRHHPHAGRHRHRLLPHRPRHRGGHVVAAWPTASTPSPTPAATTTSTASRSSSACSRNEVKVVVATSALGMGFDKPDLAFVIHYQAPGSSIAYYQQVGRAGRRLDESIGVLLRGAEDVDIQDWFINMAFPPPDVTDRVLGCLADDGGYVGLAALEKRVNLGRSRLQVLLKVLEVEGAVSRAGPEVQAHRPALALRPAPHQRRHRPAPGRAAADARLRQPPRAVAWRSCSGCSTTRARPTAAPATGAPVPTSAASRRPGWPRPGPTCATRRCVIAPRKQWPFPVDGSSKIRADAQVEEGRSLCRWGDGGWSDLVRSRSARRRPVRRRARSRRPPRSWPPGRPTRRRPGSPGCRRPAGPTRSPTWPAGSASASACPSSKPSPRCGSTSRSATWPTAPSRSTTSAPRSRSPPTCPTARCSWSTTRSRRGGRSPWSARQLRQAGCPAVLPFALTDTGGG